MGEVRSYRDLLVWQQAMDLTVSAYQLTRSWPKDELYGLTSQARRAAVSVCANIAEGYGRDTRPAYIQFLRIAQGSIKELETPSPYRPEDRTLAKWRHRGSLGPVRKRRKNCSAY